MFEQPKDSELIMEILSPIGFGFNEQQCYSQGQYTTSLSPVTILTTCLYFPVPHQTLYFSFQLNFSFTFTLWLCELCSMFIHLAVTEDEYINLFLYSNSITTNLWYWSEELINWRIFQSPLWQNLPQFHRKTSIVHKMCIGSRGFVAFNMLWIYRLFKSMNVRPFKKISHQ